MENEEDYYSNRELKFIDAVTKRLNSAALPENNDSYLEIILRDNITGAKVGSWFSTDDLYWEFTRPKHSNSVKDQIRLLKDLARDAKARGDIGKEDKDGISVERWLDGIAKRLEREGEEND